MKANFIEFNTCKLFLIVVLVCLFGLKISAQNIHFESQPDATCGKDALIGDCVPCGYDNTNFGNGEEFNALAWTNSGATSNHRSLIQFDFTSIPSGSVVSSAILHLYYNPSSSNASGLHSITSGPNDANIMRITSSWNEDSVTWNNQPSTDPTNEAYVPASINDTESYSINVTALVQDLVNDPANNFGMMIQLVQESYYRCLLFASSDHPNASLHPRIEIDYTPNPNGCFSLQYSGCDGIDALIGDCVPCGYDTTNFGDTPEFNALAWTNSGATSNHRSLIYWNFDNISASAIVQNATLSLYYNPTSSNASGLHSSTSGPNDAYLRKITSPWGEYTVTWNNQPSTITANEVYLPTSTSSTQDYLNIDVTALVQSLVSDPANNYGMMLELNTESYYRCLLFASSDNSNPALRPVLNVCYTLDDGISHTEGVPQLNVFPNPTTGAISIQIEQASNGTELSVTNALGQTVYSENSPSGKSIIHLNLASGIYFATITRNNEKLVRKIVVM